MAIHPVLIAGVWREAQSRRAFSSENPALGEKLPGEYPISDWADCDAALAAATAAAAVLRASPPEQDRRVPRRLRRPDRGPQGRARGRGPRRDRPAEGTAARRRRAAAHHGATAPSRGGRARGLVGAADDRHQAQHPLVLAPIGPVWVFGPNNFPFAFNSVAGGDFAAAIAAGNPVIAKANSSHPGTTRLLAEEAHAAATEAGLPPGTVQLIYRTSHEDGERLVSDPRTGATGYTGSRSAGLKLKAAADAAGKPIYLELSTVNPVLMLPGALAERGATLVDEFVASCLMGTGQFCTNPSLVLLVAGEATERVHRRRPGALRRCSAARRSSPRASFARWARASPRCRRPAPAWSREARPRRRATVSATRCCASRATRSWPRRRSCRRKPSATRRSSSSRETQARWPRSSRRSRAA